MKIIFDSIEEKENIINKLAMESICPDELGIEAINKIEGDFLVDDRK